MEKILSWLNQPLFPGSFLHIWMGIAGFVLLMFVIVLLLMRERKKKAEPAMSRKSVSYTHLIHCAPSFSSSIPLRSFRARDKRLLIVPSGTSRIEAISAVV